MAYWWVNQRKTYQAERSAGIMWAPQQTEAGRRLGHWTAMTQLQASDMVVHYAHGEIRALGRVEASATAADRPYELAAIWQSQGWMVRSTTSIWPSRSSVMRYRWPGDWQQLRSTAMG